MKPEQFIRDFGEKKARELLNADSDFKTYCLIDKSFWGESEGTCSFCVDLDGVKRLVESLDRVNQHGGYLAAKELLSFLIVHQEAFGKDAVSDETLNSLKAAIRDHESICGGGDEAN